MMQVVGGCGQRERAGSFLSAFTQQQISLGTASRTVTQRLSSVVIVFGVALLNSLCWIGLAKLIYPAAGMLLVVLLFITTFAISLFACCALSYRPDRAEMDA